MRPQFRHRKSLGHGPIIFQAIQICGKEYLWRGTKKSQGAQFVFFGLPISCSKEDFRFFETSGKDSKTVSRSQQKRYLTCHVLTFLLKYHLKIIGLTDDKNYRFCDETAETAKHLLSVYLPKRSFYNLPIRA